MLDHITEALLVLIPILLFIVTVGMGILTWVLAAQGLWVGAFGSGLVTVLTMAATLTVIFCVEDCE